MRLAALSLLSLIQVLQVVGLLTAPPYDPSPYTATGYITDATVNNASDVLSGGTLTFNNRVVIIPDNLLVNTPSLTAVAWSEMFNADGRINLPLWPQVSWEASIFANFINGQYIAGIVYIFQELGNLDQGFITHIDYDLGEMRIGGDFKDPNTGVRLVINDPIGRFGKVHGDWPLWTADTENPSVVASTGFPMCLPRVDPAVEVDPLCPITNRPVDTNGNFADIFTFDAPPVAAGQPDPTVFAPLVVGDFVTFSATTVPDSNGEHILAAYSIEANLGFYTTPGTRPAYLRISTLQAGINGDATIAEIAETRVEGYSTDETATIEINTIDVDPCTGAESERNWGSAVPRATAVKGFWQFRSDLTSLPPYTREVVVRISRGSIVTPNGILGGEYVSPFPPDGFIFPELLTFGNPMIPNQFDLIPFLAKGSGPWLGGIPGIPQAATGPIVGQLSPWPGVLKPALIDCPFVDPSIPVANAGSDIIVSSTADVTLVGTIKNANLDPEGVEFEWSQVSGIDVDLVNATSSRATFKAPSATSMVALTFSLNTTNAAGSTSDNVTVTVVPGNQVVDRITFETATWKAGKGSGTLTVIADSNIEGSQLILSALDADMSAIPMTSLGGGRWEILVSIRPAPTSVTVTSSFGGFAQTLVT